MGWAVIWGDIICLLFSADLDDALSRVLLQQRQDCLWEIEGAPELFAICMHGSPGQYLTHAQSHITFVPESRFV